MANLSVQTTVKVPENSVNQLFQEIEGLKQRLSEMESFKTNEGGNWFLIPILFILILLVILTLYFNYRTNLKLKKMVQNQPKKSSNEISSEKNENFVEEFIKKVIDFASRIPHNPVNEPLVNQLVKVVSSIGAVLVWTKKPDSERDFHYRINICKKKVQETEYWLKIISFSSPELKKEVEELIQEVREMTKFLDFLSRMYKNY